MDDPLGSSLEVLIKRTSKIASAAIKSFFIVCEVKSSIIMINVIFILVFFLMKISCYQCSHQCYFRSPVKKMQYNFFFYCFLLPSLRGDLRVKCSSAFYFKGIILLFISKTAPHLVESTYCVKLICINGRINNSELAIIPNLQWFFEQFFRLNFLTCFCYYFEQVGIISLHFTIIPKLTIETLENTLNIFHLFLVFP